MKMNLPNKLTILRILLIPPFMITILFDIFPGDIIWRLVSAALFGISSITDMLDGKIARKYNLITDFGKFLDPVADKLMVIAAMLCIMVRYSSDTLFSMIFVWAVFIVIFREIAVTSLRMICANKSGAVIAAAMLGKIKTVSQIVCVLVLLLEGALPFETYNILSYASVAFMTFMTVWSGADYFRLYMPIIMKEN